jgi:hypothetical protein
MKVRGSNGEFMRRYDAMDFRFICSWTASLSPQSVRFAACHCLRGVLNLRIRSLRQFVPFQNDASSRRQLVRDHQVPMWIFIRVKFLGLASCSQTETQEQEKTK